MTTRDGSTRLLEVATVGLPRRWAPWGAAMRAELAAIDDTTTRRTFARSAALAAFPRGLGLALAAIFGSALLVAALTIATSRAQLPDASPGLLSVTVPVPAAVLLIVVLLVGAIARSTRFTLTVGVAALVAVFATVVTVLAVEGQVWMRETGVFILDGDPPQTPVTAVDIAVNIFTTGMWVGHVFTWVFSALIGVAVVAVLSRPREPAIRHP